MTVPQCGRIKGGRLDGWRFHFLQFQVRDQGLVVLARCTPPRWPFPCDVPLAPQHFMSLRAVVGDRAKRIEAPGLITAAYSYAGKQVPTWLADHKGTLRACVKRAQGRTA